MLNVDSNIRPSKSLYIGGEWHAGAGEPLLSIDPATGASNATLSTASDADIDRPVETARNALDTSGWADLLPHRRTDHIHAIARLLNERTEPLAQIVMRQNGRTWAECRQQVKGAAGIFCFHASLCEPLGSEVTPSRGDYLRFTVYDQYEVHLIAEEIAVGCGRTELSLHSSRRECVVYQFGRISYVCPKGSRAATRRCRS